MKLKLILTIPLILALVGCAAKTGAPPAPPPQETVLRINNALADALNIAANTAVQLYQAGKIDLDTAQKVKVAITACVKASDAIATEAQSADPWPTMRLKILTSAASSALLAMPITDPVLKQTIQNAINLFAQIAAKAGQ